MKTINLNQVVETVVVQGLAVVVGLCLALALNSMVHFTDSTILNAVTSIVNQ